MKSIVKLVGPILFILSGCVNITEQSKSNESESAKTTLSTAAVVAATTVTGTWYSMDAQAYDVAVGSRDWIYIINNAHNPYYWNWKYGSFRPGDPAGGSWVQMATVPGGINRIASSEANVVAAIGVDGNVWRFNGNSWTNLGHPGCSGPLDLAISPSGVISITNVGGCAGYGGIYDWNGTTWLKYHEALSFDKVAPALTGGKVASQQLSQYTLKCYPDVWSTLTSQDLGGVDERQSHRTDNSYELWRTDKDGNIFYLYTGLFPNGTQDIVDSRWFQTNGRASNIAASRRSEAVVIQGSGRYVYFSSEFTW